MVTVNRLCMRDRVRDAIVTRILDGAYPPGTRLKEMLLARELNVSQAPVREALRELEALGLVESERYRGTRVCTTDLGQLREAYELRAEIEEASARRAAPCSEADIERLEADVGAMSAAMEQGDAESYMNAAVDFHRRIVQMSGNRLFLRAWEHMAWDVRARIAAQRIGGTGFHFYWDERKKVLAALRAGDGQGAGQILRHIIAHLLVHLEQIEHSEMISPAGGAVPPA